MTLAAVQRLGWIWDRVSPNRRWAPAKSAQLGTMTTAGSGSCSGPRHGSTCEVCMASVWKPPIQRVRRNRRCTRTCERTAAATSSPCGRAPFQTSCPSWAGGTTRKSARGSSLSVLMRPRFKPFLACVVPLLFPVTAIDVGGVNSYSPCFPSHGHSPRLGSTALERSLGSRGHFCCSEMATEQRVAASESLKVDVDDANHPKFTSRGVSCRFLCAAAAPHPRKALTGPCPMNRHHRPCRHG